MSAAVRGRAPRERALPWCAVKVHGRLEAANGPGLVVRGQQRFAVAPTLWTLAVHGEISPTLVQALAAAVLPSRRLVARSRVLQGRTVGTFEREGHQEWELAQQAAAHVAGTLLGLAPRLDGDGARVLAVAHGGPADGLLGPGDVVVGAGSATVRTAADLSAALRDGARRLVVLPAARDEASGEPVVVELAGSGAAGLQVATHRPRTVGGLDVDVELCADAAGASSGLVLALALLDVLTPGSLTGGLHVAVTGALDLDGRVGEVGGVLEKARAAAAVDVDLLLVPQEGLAEALRGVRGSRTRVVAVGTVEEAVAVLVAAGGAAPSLPRSVVDLVAAERAPHPAVRSR